MKDVLLLGTIGLVIVLLLTGCSFGWVGQPEKEGERGRVWGIAWGNAKVENCLTVTKLDTKIQRTPEGEIITEQTARIESISEDCHRIAGAAISDQAGSVFELALAPFRWILGPLAGP